MKRAILLILISLLCASVYAQGLADIARRERERRAAAESAARKTVVDAPAPAVTPATPATPATPGTPLITLTTTRPTSPADIGGVKDDVFRFYDIRGTTAAELRAEIARQGPLSEGARHQAVTNWRITWQPLTSSIGGKCSVTSMNLMLTVEIVFPRWVNELGAPLALSENWRKYLTGLLGHEHGHKDIALAGAEEVRQLPKTALPQGTCAASIAAANAAGKAVVDRTVARQRKYDKDTDHGRGQGVRLP